MNKKKQKNFAHFSAGLFQHRAKRSKKVFWFFFSKKNCLIPEPKNKYPIQLCRIAKFAELSIILVFRKGASNDQQRQCASSIDPTFAADPPGGMGMNDLSFALHPGIGIVELGEAPCRALLRTATQAPHERLHLHEGFSAVKDGRVTLPEYRALLIRLYGFYQPFEIAAGAEHIRTGWLERDLASLGVDAAARAGIRLCADIPQYDSLARRLGALYVVEGSALGGIMLCRGLDGLLGDAAMEGRRFFAGRGANTGAAWRGFLDRLDMAGAEPIGRAALIGAAVETFLVFETWLGGWNKAV